jgi:HD-GYP domain-containing protein (c-di-GMP phosphodiesterase class II)
MNLAFASLYLRDYARGLDAAERAIAVLGESHSADEKRHRVMAEFYYTHLLLASRNVPRAVERARLARMHAHGAGALAELFAEMAQGLAEVYDRATRDIGLSRLQGAVNKARLGIPSALRIALATLVRAYEAAGQPNSALIYYQEVMQLNRDSRVKNLIEHQQLFINRRLKELDAQADAALALQKEEIKFRRFSMDVFSELTLLLEENSVAAELHDDDTGEHCYRVGSWASELARKKGLDEDSCVELDISARLHDIGKLEVPDTILLKPGKFTPEERAIMEQHCEFGWRLLQRGGLGQLFVAQEIALNHHERWDGTGYPRKISGEMIPLAARITAIGDVYDALTSKRTYKDAWPHEKAISYIAENRGKHFDPELTDMFLELVPDLQKEHGNLNAYLARKKRSDFIENRERVARELKTDLGTFDARR